MRFPDQKYPHSNLTSQVIGCAMEVHNTLRNGLTEKIYENSLCLELAAKKLHINQQLEFPVHYRSHFVGKLIPDLVVENKVIVDTKVVEEFNSSHTSQILSYLNITGLQVGILINFKHASLQFKRISNITNFNT